jgi:hypothetical protein
MFLTCQWTNEESQKLEFEAALYFLCLAATTIARSIESEYCLQGTSDGANARTRRAADEPHLRWTHDASRDQMHHEYIHRFVCLPGWNPRSLRSSMGFRSGTQQKGPGEIALYPAADSGTFCSQFTVNDVGLMAVPPGVVT